MGALFFMIGVMELIGGLASRDWDAVSGEIIESRFTLTRWQRVNWEVEIRYRYTIEGRTYEGDRFCFGTGMTVYSLRAAERAVTTYPKGRIVTLFVSPSDRSRAVIEPGVGWRVAMPFLAGGLLIALGIGSILR